MNIIKTILKKLVNHKKKVVVSIVAIFAFKKLVKWTKLFENFVINSILEDDCKIVYYEI